jgi:hypothetical protein
LEIYLENDSILVLFKVEVFKSSVALTGSPLNVGHLNLWTAQTLVYTRVVVILGDGSSHFENFSKFCGFDLR